MSVYQWKPEERIRELEAELVQVRADYDAANYLAERTSHAWKQAKAERDTLEAETRWAMERIFAYVTEQYSSKDFMERADDVERAQAWLAANPPK
jgi:molecular chaperone GrpE (heat shock protein)